MDGIGPPPNEQQQFDNMFYLAQHAEGGHSPALILTAVLLNCVGLPGFLANLSVLLVTCRHRALHGSANFLLALTSLFEMGHEAGHLLFLWMALSGHNFLPYWLAFRLISLPIFCIGGIFASMMSTGVDRLLCVLLPHFHARLHMPAYLTLHCLFCGAVSAWLLLTFSRCARLYADYPVTGGIADLIIGECGPAYTYSSMASNIGTIFMYLLVGMIVRWQSSRLSGQQPPSSSSGGTNNRLFRSLAVIIVANIGGYFYVSIMRAFVLPQLQLSATMEWYFNSYDGILLNISSAINAPVLYFLSKDYRTAFDKEWAKLRSFRTTTGVSPASIRDTIQVSRSSKRTAAAATVEKRQGGGSSMIGTN